MTEPQAPWQVREWPDGPPPRPPRPAWLLPVLIGGSLVLLVFVAGFIALVSFIASLAGSAGPFEELVEGDPGSPVADAPLVCAVQCFTSDSVEEAIASDGMFRVIGVPDATFPNGTYEPVAVGELYRRDITGWTSYGGAPDQCFFVPASAPYAPAIDPAIEDNSDLVHFLGTHEDADRLNSVEQAARVFPDSAAAEAYMAQLAGNIELCTTIALGPDSDRYSAQVDPAAELGSLPDSVAAIGWVRTGDPGIRWRSYTFMEQRGNLVMMSRLLTDGSISEVQFRSFALSAATVLGELEAVAPPVG